MRRIRFVIMAASCWFLLFEPLRFFIFGIARYGNASLNRVVDTLSLLVLGAATIYLMVQIRTITKVIRLVLLGVALFIIAQGLHVSISLLLPDALLVGPWGNAFRSFLTALSAVGTVLAVAGLLYAIVELLVARHQSECERSRISQEIAVRERTQRALSESEEKYRTLVENTGEVIAILDDSGVFVFMNHFAAGLLGGNPDDFVGKSAWDLFPQEIADRHVEAVRRVIRSGQPSAVDNQTVVGGTTRWYRTRITPLTAVHGPQATVLIFASDITDRVRAEKTLHESEERYRALFEQATDSIVVLDVESGMLVNFNDRAHENLGYTREEFEKLRMTDIEIIERDEEIAKHIKRIFTEGSDVFETKHRSKGGEIRDVQVHSRAIALDGPRIILSTWLDITERKQAENRQELTVRILELLDRPNILTDAIKEILPLVKRWGGFDAVGIRLREGDDYPYYETSGFPEQFVEAERYLCGRDEYGETMRDPSGHAYLECMCGNVIAGRTDPSLPFFTKGGSFWTNSTSELLATTSEEDRQTRTRNRCNREGYESVALIALRSEQTLVGFLQLNDHRTGMFTLEMIEFLEGIGASVGVALGGQIAQEVIEASEVKYRDLVENANSIILRIDTGGRVTFLNQFGERFFGYTEDEILGKNVVGTIVPETDSSGRDLAAMIIDVGRHPERYESNENENMRRNGERVWIDWRNKSICDEGGETREILCIGNDVTARKKAQEALVRLETAIEQAGEVVAIMDRGWKIVYANPAFEAVTGYSRDEAMGCVLQTVAGDAHAAAVYRDISTTVECGDTWRGRVTARKRDDTTYQAEATLSPVRNPAGEIVNFVCVWRDVTREVALDAELRHAQKMEAIGMLAGGIAHRFRNILSSILGFSEVALKHAEKGSELEMCLTRMAAGANRAVDVVQRIMTFSRREELARRPLDIGAAVGDAVEFLRGALPRTVEFRQEIDSACEPVLADPAEILQVILDLGSNASYAMRKHGGVFKLSLRQVESAPDLLGLAPGKYAQLSVSDTGHGIPAEVIGHIFDPFFTTKSAGEGTGFGLSAVHEVVTSLGGAIEVHSEVGKGAEFTLFLPVCTQPDGSVEETQWDQANPGGRERVLFVDDDASLVTMAEMGLGALGYTVEGFTDSLKALDAFRDTPDAFDVVIVDQVMLGLTGTALAREIADIRPDIPIILSSGFTGFSEQPDEQEVKEASVSEYVAKPASPNQLARAIRRVLKKSRSTRV